jgi:NAD(P)-dependent dehydrogenase (short-subunit alcohol dehydrogenase family)
VNKAELESKHISELHALAAEAGMSGYRMLRREELVEKLAGGSDKPSRPSKPRGGRERQQRQRRSREGGSGERRERPKAQQREAKPRPKPEPPAAAKEEPKAPAPEESRRPRRRRRRRFGRRRKELRLHDALQPGAGGHAIAYADTREACTAMLREFATELSGSDPVVLLVEPGPEELAEWRRDVPQAEIVAAAQARHAEDALGQAARRAASGESVVVLIDSLSRFGEAFGDAGAAKDLLDVGRESSSLTVVAALERR